MKYDIKLLIIKWLWYLIVNKLMSYFDNNIDNFYL